MAINIHHKITHLFTSRYTLAATVIILSQWLFTDNVYAEIKLTPYTASYTSNVKGMSAKLKRSLKKTDNEHWSLNNETSVLFASFTERSSFFVQNDHLKPVDYRYENPVSKKRNSKLRFDWSKNIVTETAKSTPALTLTEGMLDKLTFQEQLRMDLITQGEQFKEKTYTLVDRGKPKNYTISYLGEETITTAVGTFTAVKIKQHRPGKKKHTVIWLAKDWQYFIVRIELFEEGKSRYQIALQSASIGGRKMAAIASAH